MRWVEATATPACLAEVHAALDALAADAKGMPRDAHDRFRIAVAELVANVVEHGRGPDGRPPHIVLELEATADRLIAVLRDDADAPPPPPPGPPDPLAESGRGLRLAHGAADAIEHDRAGAGNRWRVVVRRRDEPPGR